MSIESAKAFAERTKSDTDFRQSVLDAADRVQFVKDAGFDFTQEEWHQVKGELRKGRGNSDEMSEGEMKNVAAGVSCLCTDMPHCWCVGA